MDYDLSRIDYAICGITFPDTLKILPAPGPKLLQKFAVGDKNGVLQCLSIKDEEPLVHFKTLPGKPITSVQLSSTAGAQSDKIFAASGNEVKGYTRKGKVFLTIETSLSETITSMCVIGSDLVLGSGRMVTHYRDLREFQSYACEDRVLDLTVFAAPNSTRLRVLAIIANKGAIILEGGNVAAKTTFSSGPTRLLVPPLLHGGDVCAFYGAADGSLGIIMYNGSELSSRCLMEGNLGPVMCLGWFFNASGNHLAVGRHDGSIQLYLINLESLLEKPRLKYTYFCGEPVTSVTGGYIGSEASELLATTFSGRIFALRSRHVDPSIVALTNVSQDAVNARRTKLEAEVARLEKQVANEREKYQKSTRSVISGLSAPPLLDIQCEMSGATWDGWQEVRVISAVPLDMLFLYSQKKLELSTDTSAVLSICPSQDNSNDLLATVRCQAGTRRLWLRMRKMRGSTNKLANASKLIIYALPAGAPRVSRLMSLRLPALPLYSQHVDPELIDNEERCWCQLLVSGTFSVAEMTSWLNDAFPGDLPRPSSIMFFARSHALLNTNLICRYQKGQATFKCENISTIANLRDFISNCSVEKDIRLEMSFDIPKEWWTKHFKLIEEQFTTEYKKHKDFMLMKAIRSLDLDVNAMDEETPVLCEDYRRNSKLDEDVQASFEDLVEVVEGWYDHWHILQLKQNNETEKAKLSNALRSCQVAEIFKLFSDDIPTTENTAQQFDKLIIEI